MPLSEGVADRCVIGERSRLVIGELEKIEVAERAEVARERRVAGIPALRLRLRELDQAAVRRAEGARTSKDPRAFVACVLTCEELRGDGGDLSNPLHALR